MILKTRAPVRRALRNRAIGEYHDMLAADEALSSEVFEKLHSAMREHRLVFGERPIGVSLRPHLLDEKQFRSLTQNSELLASALEKIAGAVLQNPAWMSQLGLSDREISLAMVDPGFSAAALTTRLDSFVHGNEIKLLECNAENPSGLSDQEGLNRILMELPAMTNFAKRYNLRGFSPAERLLETLLAAYREWGGVGGPNIAILDWAGLPTANEFVLLRDHFTAHGIRTVICAPEDLDYRDGKLRCGDVRIDLVYKRILIHEFLKKFDQTHPLIRAYLHHDVCLVNSFRCKILHKKACFEMLTDEEHQRWFTRRESEAIRRCVPWTRRVTDRHTTRHGRSIDLLEFIRRNRSRLVLKPNDDYGGRGVYLGPRLDERTWGDAVATALAGDYVVQDAIDLQPEDFPVFSATDWNLQPMFVDTNPFLFRGKVCGAMVRLSDSPLLNVTGGGGETGFFVIEDAA